MIRIAQPRCPECEQPAIGTRDQVPCVAVFDGDPTAGPVEWSGDINVDWAGQQMECGPGKRSLVQCDNGHVWATTITLEQVVSYEPSASQ